MKKNKSKSKMLSVLQYARLCGFNSPHPIYRRRDRGQITFTTVKHRGLDIYLVDPDLYPPLARQSPGRRQYPN